MPVDVIVAIISGLLGGGALTTLLKWLFDRIDRQSHQPTREEIEQLQQWAANDYTRLQKADREHDEIRSELRELRLERMREELFTHPHSKISIHAPVKGATAILESKIPRYEHKYMNWCTHTNYQLIFGIKFHFLVIKLQPKVPIMNSGEIYTPQNGANIP